MFTGPLPPVKSTAVATAGSDLMMIDEAGSDLLHGLKRNVLGGADAAPQIAGVPQGEKSLGHNHEKIDIHGNGDQQDSERERLMPQNPFQAAIVDAHHGIKGLFIDAIDPPVRLPVFPLQKAGAHHGRHREGNEQRNQNRHGKRDGKLAEQAAHDAGHHQDAE